MVAVVSIPTLHLWRFEQVLDCKNIMRTRVGDCQAARSAHLPAAPAALSLFLSCHASWRFRRMVVCRSQASVDLSTLALDCRSASDPETVSSECDELVQNAPSARSATLLDQAGSRSDLLLAWRPENRCLSRRRDTSRTP